MTEAIFTLKDDRKLSYAIYGPEDGMPVLYFHGTPSSRREILLLKAYDIDFDAVLFSAGIRLIAVDRHALTTFTHQRTFLSFADDAVQLLRHLNIQACSVLCWSGGGPYALAVACKYPQLIQGVYILCGITKQFDPEVMQQMGSNKWYFRTARFAPLLLHLALRITRRRNIRSLPPQGVTGLPYIDYTLLQKRIKQVAGLTLKEATRKGTRSTVHEAASYYKDFDFDIGEIQQPIHYWWGTKDMSVVEAHAREIEQKAQRPIMHYREDEGHLSLYLKCFGEAIQTIALSHPKQKVAGR
ncbi:MAG: alpha/beta hydrolase [Chitinophagaceae bacterium]|nr:MAG: alpha/beta hydrolase [Chitinophagaceae bacterium]